MSKATIINDDKKVAASFVRWMKRHGYDFESNDDAIMRKNLWPFFARHREKFTGVRIVERKRAKQ